MENSTKKEKILQVIIIVLTVIIVFGLAYFASELKNCKSCNTVEKVDFSLINKVAVKNLSNSKEKKTFGDLYDSDEYSIVYFARPTCGHCQVQTPIMQEIADKYKTNIYYLNTDELKNDEFLQLFKLDTDLFGNDGSNFGTPTIIILQSGKVIDSIVGTADKDQVIQLFSTYKLMK